MQTKIDSVLIPQEAIARRVGQLAAMIAADYQRDTAQKPAELLIVPVLTGSMIFAADLIRRLPLPLRLHLLTVSSYPGKSLEARQAVLSGILPEDLSKYWVLVVDDILDSGQTLRLLDAEIRQRNPASLRSCVLLRKSTEKGRDVKVDYSGFDIPDAFVVGYGLDFDGFYRNLPDIVTLKPEAYQ